MIAIMPWQVIVLALAVLFLVVVLGGVLVVRALVRNEQREGPGPYPPGPYPPGPYPPGPQSPGAPEP